MRKIASSFLAVLMITAVANAAPGIHAAGAKLQHSEFGLTLPSAEPAADIVRGYVGRSAGDLAVQSEASSKNGARHVRLQQMFDGRPVYGAYVRGTVDAQGRLRHVIDASVEASSNVKRSSITADTALSAALGHRYAGKSAPAFFRSPLVQPVVLPTDGGLEEGYLVETWELRSNDLWHTVVNGSGKVVSEEHRTNTDSYFIFSIHPNATPQAVVSGPGSAGNAESPLGWVTNNTTIGNNVDAYLDRDNSNTPDATNARPVSATQDFIYAWDSLSAPTTAVNQNLAVANLFYLNNVIHDKLYRHGFVEAQGNFQTNNFGKGGAGNDAVLAEAQDGGGTNNANFATPADGSKPRMQMYLWNTATPSRDGDIDADVVFHEYGHGLTWRMFGSMGGGLAGSIGEGMSDTVACYMTGQDTVGEYVKNNTVGIRRYPYTNYPLTYRSANTTSVHANGEIYAATMWKLRGLWLNAGYSMDELWDYVIDGMNFTPANPEYEEMRNGILQAVPTQAQDCIVWDAFASMGIGVNAVGTDSCNFLGNCTINITEDFTKPAVCGGTPAPYTLTASGAISGGRPRTTLNWAGATGSNVDIFRNNVRITTTANDGNHVDQLSKNQRGTFTYKVCNAGTTTCSNNASVTY